MKILLVTPPFVQLNTPYPATTELKAYLASKGHEVTQCDLSIETAEKIFSREFLEAVFREAFERDRLSFGTQCVASQKERYLGTVDAVWGFLRGDDDTMAPLIASPDYLPHGRRFAKQDEETLEWAFGTCGLSDRARHMATLYIEDLSDFIAEIVSPDFSPVRYGEQLAISAASFDGIYERIKGERNAIDRLMCGIFKEKMETIRPDMVGFSVPFPGTLTSALMLSDTAAKENYEAIRVMGGGYVNTELRSLSDGRIFDFVDFITFDDGQLPLERLCDLKEGRCSHNDLVRTVYRRDDGTLAERLNVDCNIPFGQLPPPDFSDFDRTHYISLTELTNPMHKLWSDGRWNKMTVAHGCYHKKCAFCDTSLDYIGRYDAPSPEVVVERMEHIVAQTGIRGFHFTDEALPPALLAGVCRLIVERGIAVTFWGNIRFEKSYTPELCALMRQAGCIAVSGGMEVAHERVLALMGKGITVEGARRCGHNGARLPYVRLPHSNRRGVRPVARDGTRHVRRRVVAVGFLAPLRTHATQPGRPAPRTIRMPAYTDRAQPVRQQRRRIHLCRRRDRLERHRRRTYPRHIQLYARHRLRPAYTELVAHVTEKRTQQRQ